MTLPLQDLVDTSAGVAGLPGRLDKISRLAALLRRTPPRLVPHVVAYLSGDLPQGRIGIGYAAVRAAWPDAGAPAPSLSVAEVDAAFSAIASTTGRGSAAERARLLHDLLGRATREEQEFLVRLIAGELRQGALEGVMVDAVARAAGIAASHVRRTLMLAGDLPAIAGAALEGGEAALSGFGLRLFQPLQPMLADSVDDAADALGRFGEAAFDFKLDGARVQVHRAGADVRVFTRRLNEVTSSVPELVDSVRQLATSEIILDGEVIALRPDGSPLPFQTTMRRFGRKLDIERLRAELPLATFFFDCLYLDGETIVDAPARDRFAALEQAAPSALRIPRIVTPDPAAASRFMEQARNAGHEGLVAKALDASYEAGRRGQNWLKIKPANTLDLVVLAAEWGHGRRRGWLSNLHLGARDTASGAFIMLGKTFKGMTDKILAWQTAALQRIAIGGDDYTVHVRPELVVEVAFNEVQASPRYPAGLALRFARIKGYRPDKTAAEADTIDTVREIFAKQGGRTAG